MKGPSVLSASLVLMLGLASPAFAQFDYSQQILLYDGGKISQISDTEWGQVWEPRINDRGDIVWTTEAGELLLYDGTTTTLLSSSNPSHPEINDTGQVVWETLAEGDENIVLYDGTDTIQITDDLDYVGDTFPQINNRGDVAWLRGHGVYVRGEPYTYDVVLYDGTGMIQLIDDEFYDEWPKLNNLGQVVWQGGADNPDYYYDENTEIFLYDGTSTIQLTNNDRYDGRPQINDAGQVVWEGYDGSDSEIFLFDGVETLQLTDNAIQDMEPQINNNGHVVWHGGLTYETSEIFLFDGMSIRTITNDIFYDHHPIISDNGQVVWTRQYLPLSLGIGAALLSQEIMFYDGSRVTSLSKKPFSSDASPDTNAHGQVVWQAQVPEPWQAASVVGANPQDISKGLNYSFALLVPLAIVALFRRLLRGSSPG